MATNLTDAKLRALPFEAGQRDYPGRDGLFVRVGRKTKTFIVAIDAGDQRQRIAIGRYPHIGLSAARALRTEAAKQTGDINSPSRTRSKPANVSAAQSSGP